MRERSHGALCPRFRCWLPLLLSHARKVPQAEEAGKINDFPFISSPSHSLLSRTALLALSCRLIKIRVGSLRDGSIISSPHRAPGSLRAGIGWPPPLQSGATRQAILLPSQGLHTPRRGQAFSRDSLAPSLAPPHRVVWARGDLGRSQLLLGIRSLAIGLNSPACPEHLTARVVLLLLLLAL